MHFIYVYVHHTRVRLEIHAYLRSSFHAHINIVTYRPIARQRLGKRIPVGANARNNRTRIARQRISKHA
jgi:hypothetical protein